MKSSVQKFRSKYRIPSDSDENDSCKDSPVTPSAVPIMFKGVQSRPKHACILCDHSFPAWKDLFAHLSIEPGVNIFTCLKCSLGFLSWTALREHERNIHGLSRNSQNTDSMLDIIGHVLVCGDCGVHVVVIANPFGVVKANYDSLKEHCTGNFRKLSFFSWSTSVKEYLGKCSVPKALNIRIKFVPYLVGVPLKCKECSTEIMNYDQIEDHAFLKHSSKCVFKTCTICSKNFSNEFTFETHTTHSHTSERYFLLEFLSSYPNTPPFVAAGLKSTDRLHCDLCARNIPINEFNKHDCAVNYTRRLEVDGSIVKCPSIILNDLSIDLSSKNLALTSSVGKKFSKMALITLKYSNLGLESLNVVKSKEHWSCRCCELIFDKSQSFVHHLSTFHRLQLNSASFATTDKIFLLQYGDIVHISDDGCICPKADCGAVFCSIPAVEWHLKVKHCDEFVHYTSLRSSSNVIEPPSLLPMSGSSNLNDIAPPAIKRKKAKTDSSNMAISNVFSLAGGSKSSSVAPKPTSVAPKPPSSSSSSSSSSTPDSQTVLLHPPPIPNMKAGMYSFVVTHKPDAAGGPPKMVGMFQSSEQNSVQYFVDPSQIEALVNVANNGRTKFAVGCIPSNYKLPEGIKLPPLPAFPVLNVPVSTSFLTSTVDLSSPPPSAHWECPICSIKSSSVIFLRNHLKETHNHLCSKCGSCFVTAEHEHIHRLSESCPQIQPNAVFICSKCSNHFEILKDYYSHLIDNHQTDVSFDEATGQVYPSCTIEFSTKLSTVATHPVAQTIGKSADVSLDLFDTGSGILDESITLSSQQGVENLADSEDVTIVEQSKTGAKRKVDDQPSADEQPPKRIATAADADKSLNLGANLDDSETSSSCSSDVADETVDKAASTINTDDTPSVVPSSQLSNVAALIETFDTSGSGLFMTPPDGSQPSQEKGISCDSDDINIVEAKTTSVSNVEAKPAIEKTTTAANFEIDDEIEILSSDDESAGPSVSREKNIQCSMCSRLFRTQRAVDEHKKSHMYDAGATSELSLPVPFNMDVYVCRLCCLAYESYETFQMHVKKHGTVLACTRCTAVSLSMDLLQSHINAHDSGKLVFGCTTCHSAMRSEKNLLLHMHHEHNSLLIWNCQKCSKANTNWTAMAVHVSQEHKLEYNNLTSIVLPCAHCKLHFQPENLAEYKNPVSMQNFTVGECPHRTFSAYAETLVGCPKCGSMIAATKYLLENEELRKEGQFKLFLVEENIEKQEEARHPVFSHNTTPLLFRNVAVGQNTSAIRSILDNPSSTVVTTNKVILSQNSVIRKTGPTTTSTVASTTTNLIPGVSTSNYCHICRVNYTSQAALKVHLMKHDSVNVIFCLECGFSSKSAYNFFYHLLITHGSKLKGNVWCVCQNCGENMNDLDVYLKHQHIGLHKCETCGVPNYSMEALVDHSWRHTKYGPHCCPFCSACFDAQKTMEVHRIRHACENWVMCRECGMCYKNMDQLEKHYVTTHLAQGLNSIKSRCHLCGESVNQTPLFHLLARHTVFAVRLKQTLHLPPSLDSSKMFDITYLDLTKFREIYICQHCTWIAYDVDGARMHARTSHTSGNFWTVLVSPMVARVSPIVSGRCSYCNFSSTFQVVMEHLQVHHFQTGRFTCDVCEEYFDSPYDRDYHSLFNHGKRCIESPIQDMHAFSPLNCPLCGIFVTDATFMKHLSSHTLTQGPIGYVILEICSVCGICFINKSEEMLNLHSNSHKKNARAVVLAQKRTFYKFRAVEGVVAGTEPPTCDICDEILMWNAPLMIAHVVQKHFRTNSEALWNYHKSHHKDVVATGSNCRMCTFLNVADHTLM